MRPDNGFGSSDADRVETVNSGPAPQDVPSKRPTRPDVATPAAAGDTQTVHLPVAPAAAGPQQPAWPPQDNRGPTPTYHPLPPPPLMARPRKQRRRLPVIVTVAVAVVVTVAIAGVLALALPRLTRHAGVVRTQHSYTSQPTVLPFPDLKHVKSAAVDGAGTLYLVSSLVVASGADDDTLRLLTLAKGATSSTMKDLPGIDMRFVTDLTVDTAGNLFISDTKNVWELAAGAAKPIRLPFRGLVLLAAIAVDAAGNIYAAGSYSTGGINVRYVVEKLPPGANRPTDLPFTDLYLPHALAVDQAGNVYVGDAVKGRSQGRVSKLAANASKPAEVSFPGLQEATRMAVDSAGNLFVVDDWQQSGVYELRAGAMTAAKLPRAVKAAAVAVDSADVVYLAASATFDSNDRINKAGQVLKLSPDG